MTENNAVGTVTDWTDDQWLNFTFWLKDLLRQEVVDVVFTKTDGTERVMKCTMKTSVIDDGVKLLKEKSALSEVDGEKTSSRTKKSSKSYSSDHITVWDLEAKNWRSFRARKLTNVLTLIMRYDYSESTNKFNLTFL